MRSTFSKFKTARARRKERGATLVEYALLIGGALLAAVALQAHLNSQADAAQNAFAQILGGGSTETSIPRTNDGGRDDHPLVLPTIAPPFPTLPPDPK